MRLQTIASMALMASLSGCGNPYYFGTSSNTTSANTAAFASPTSDISDTATKTFEVRYARFITDPNGQTRFLITNETLTFVEDEDEHFTFTMNGETITFISGQGEMANGQDVWSYLNYYENAATAGIYAYDYGESDPEDGQIDTEGFFVFGHETTPQVLALRSDAVSYDGDYDGYGQMLSPDGSVDTAEVYHEGNIAIDVNFATGGILGALNGSIEYETYDFDATFASSLNGNGFAADLIVNCPAGSTCTTNHSGIGGVFFGPNGEEIAGIMGCDIERIGDENFRFVSAGEFFTSNGETIPVPD